MMNQKTATNGGAHPVRMWAAAALLALASVTTGCPGNSAECQVATDCPGDQVCNASNECVTPTPLEPDPGPNVNPDECANVFCSGQGQCAVANGEAVCICNAGYSPSGLECIEDTDSCDGVDCSGNGTCAIANGAAVCICDEGFDAEGLTCIASTDPCNGVTCSGQGNCAVSNDAAVCICNDGYTPNGLECVSNNDPCAGVTCSGQGTCESTNDTVSCNCNTGYSPNGLQCIADGDPCEGVTCSGEGTCAEVNGAPQCNCNTGFTPEGLTCVADVVVDGGTGPGPVVPETWTCSAGSYDDGTCDCGCGALDEDCADPTETVCEVNHCDEGTPKNDDNSQCFPSLWLCNGEYWGDDDCDCGCGIVDIDCPAATSDVCEFTLCQDGNDTAKPTNNAVCYPDTWTCSGDFYDDNAKCDCGCGIADPDCADALVGSCEFCSGEGSCSQGSTCPGAIDPADNSSCNCVPQCDACREVGAPDTCGGTCEANCAGTCNGDVCIGAADIASLELTIDSATATAGEDVLVRHRYGNLGGTVTGDFDYAFFLHTSATNVESGTRLRTFSPLELPPGESRGPFAVSLTIPPGTAAGTYFIGAVYDVENTVTESDEANNSRTVQVTVGAGQADLTVSALSVDITTLSAGDDILATYTRINNGSSATGGFVDGFFLSSDPVITPDDTLQRSNNRLSLAPGEQLAATDIPVTIGSGTPPGTYYFGYFVDVDETVAESDETNNYRSVQIVVQGSGLPDLRPQGFNVLTTDAVAPGDVLAVEYSRVNQGDAASGAFHFSVRVSDNNVITTLDEEVFGLNASSIPPGGTQGPFSGINVDLPADLHAGVYWAGAIIDDTNAVTESNEDNNTSNIREFFVVPDTCDKYIQYGRTAAGQSEPAPYLYFDGTTTCPKVDGTSGVCLDNDSAATASAVGFFADTTHGDSFPTIYGGFPSNAESDDYFSMHVDDNFGATLDIEVSLAGDDATGDLDLEVYFVCDTSDPTASESGGTTCQSSTAAGEPAVLCRNFNSTPDETVTFAPNCDGFDEGGTVYVRVNRFGNYAGCAPYSISGHF